MLHAVNMFGTGLSHNRDVPEQVLNGCAELRESVGVAIGGWT